MNNILKTILIISIAILGAGALGVSDTQANSGLVVEFEQTPLFGEANFLPGDSIIRWAKVTNNSANSESIAVETIEYIGWSNPNNVPLDDLSRALYIVIKEHGGSDLYGGTTGAKTLYNLFEEGETLLTADLSGNGGQIIYDFEIGFSSDKADEWQTKTTQFDILVGFQGQEGGAPLPPDPLPPGGSSGSGGTPVPGLTIIKNPEITFDPNDPNNDATIEWTTSYKSTSQVVYSVKGEPPTPEEPHTFKFNEPYYGYAHAYPDPEDFTKKVNHIVVIPDLIQGRTYYYRVVSHASPPTISREYTFTVPEVKGAATQTQTQTQTGTQTSGATQGNEQNTGIGQKFVQGISSVLGTGSGQGQEQEKEQEDKEILSLDTLDNLGFIDDEVGGFEKISDEISDDVEERDFPLNLTADLSSVFDNFDRSRLLGIAVILFFLFLATLKVFRNRKKRKNKV